MENPGVRPLEPRQAKFVEEYLIDLNQTKAAIRAGYAESGASTQAVRLLAKANIQEAIRLRRAKISKATDITPERVVAELAKLGFSNMMDYVRITPGGDPMTDLSDITRDQAAALAEITVEDFTEGRGDNARDVRRVKFKLADKRAALVDIGKHLGMFVDRLKIDPDSAPLVQVYLPANKRE